MTIKKIIKELKNDSLSMFGIGFTLGVVFMALFLSM